MFGGGGGYPQGAGRGADGYGSWGGDWERGGGAEAGWSAAIPSWLTEDQAAVRWLGSDLAPCTNTACGKQLALHYATCNFCFTFQDKVWVCPECGLFSRGDAERCRYAPTMGCPGAKSEGHAPTKAERDRAIETMRQAKVERGGYGGGKGESHGYGGGKGESHGKGENHGKGAGGKGKGKGKGQHAGAAGGGTGGAATRVSVMEAAERGVASGDTDRLVKDILRAHLGL
jgi:hypothetical protein